MPKPIPQYEEVIMNYIKEYLMELENSLADTVEEIIKEKLAYLTGIIEKRAVQGIQGLKGDKPVLGVDYELEKINEEEIKQSILGQIPVPKDGKDADENKIVRDVLAQIPVPKDGKDGINGSSDTAEEIRDKLQSLKEADRLDVSAIKGIMELLKTIKSQKMARTGGGGDTVRYVDLSSSLDGATKTFTLTRVARVISVHSTEYPITLRPEVDWTFATATGILTLTAQVAAPASGQSLYVVYIES